jgi:CheY-like chemotaxis protein
MPLAANSKTGSRPACERTEGTTRAAGRLASQRERYAMTETTVFIVEDETLLALDLETLCQDFGCRVLGVARSAAEALSDLAGLRPAILLTDMELGGARDGADVAEAARRDQPSIVIVFVTGTQAADKLEKIERLRPARILRKPLRSCELRETLEDVAA